MTEILAMCREEEQLREQLKAAEQQQADTEITLESVRLDASNKKAEQERCTSLPARLLFVNQFSEMCKGKISSSSFRNNSMLHLRLCTLEF